VKWAPVKRKLQKLFNGVNFARHYREFHRALGGPDNGIYALLQQAERTEHEDRWTMEGREVGSRRSEVGRARGTIRLRLLSFDATSRYARTTDERPAAA